jgi:hypothetical protein
VHAAAEAAAVALRALPSAECKLSAVAILVNAAQADDWPRFQDVVLHMTHRVSLDMDAAGSDNHANGED